MSEEERTSFRASLPPIQGAIRLAGDGGARIQLDVPDTDMAAMLKVMLWRDRVLCIVVRPLRE